MKTYSYIPRIFLVATMALNSATVAMGKDSGGGGGGKASIGIEAGYHPYAQSWVQGQKDRARFLSAGAGWLIYMTNHDGPKPGVSFSVPSFAIWGDVLENTYEEADPSGTRAKEIMKSQGIGLGFVGRDGGSGIAVAVLLGAERMYIDQTGDSPRSQKYPYGASSRLGLGYSPIQGSFALDLRVDWRFKHFPSVKSGGDSLKPLQQQSFSPVIGISYNK